MSEVPFFAASTAALVCLEQSKAPRSWRWLGAGIALAALSIELRTAGCGLAGAVVVALCRHFNLRISKRAAIVALLISSIPLAIVLAHTRYVYQVTYGEYVGFGSPANAVVESVERKTKLIGEFVANYAAFNAPLIYREEFTLLGSGLSCFRNRRMDASQELVAAHGLSDALLGHDLGVSHHG